MSKLEREPVGLAAARSCSRIWVASRVATICPCAHPVAGRDQELLQDAAFEVLDGLALALGEQHAVGDDGAVEAGVHAPADQRAAARQRMIDSAARKTGR